MRLIEAMVSTGYLPLAVPRTALPASVPSSTALATSDTSARVGTGLEIIDSIIWVAVYGELVVLARKPNHSLLQRRDRGIADLDARSPRATMIPSQPT